MSVNLPITNTTLLTKALTHRSYLNEHDAALEHNERLEFLGDAVLELAVSEFLFAKYPDSPEGDLTAFRASLVKTTTLAETAAELEIGERILMSKGEENSGGRSNRSLLANTFEAVLGAMYLDQGYSCCVSFLQEHLFGKIDGIVENNLHKDFKSSLQEQVQADGYDSPIYEVIHEEGPDHDKLFTVIAKVGGQAVSQGVGKSKQKAQQAAAQAALEKYKSD